MLQVLLVLISGLMLAYGLFLFRSISGSREIMRQEKGSYRFYALVSAAVMFFSTFGVSDTAMNIFAFRTHRCVEDGLLPGTIITCSILPVGAMALAFLTSVEAEPVTLAVCVCAQTAGAFLGVKFILKMKDAVIRKIMGTALLGTVLLILVQMLFFGLDGGTGSGLTSWRLYVTALAFCVFGALNMAGLGATVPNMAVLLLMGMDHRSVFPIVMTGNFISCCFAGFRCVWEGKYTRKAAAASAFGVVGVLTAVFFVRSMNVKLLEAVMIGVLLYCAFTMLWPVNRKKRAG